ncbi:hypothetical protein Lser_V15G38228 [Lactuca serriola]
MENKIMDELARKTTLLEVQSVQLNRANKEIDYLKSEQVVIKCYVSDVFSILSNLVNAHDSVLNVTTKPKGNEALGLSVKEKAKGIMGQSDVEEELND